MSYGTSLEEEEAKRNLQLYFASIADQFPGECGRYFTAVIVAQQELHVKTVISEEDSASIWSLGSLPFITIHTILTVPGGINHWKCDLRDDRINTSKMKFTLFIIQFTMITGKFTWRNTWSEWKVKLKGHISPVFPNVQHVVHTHLVNLIRIYQNGTIICLFNHQFELGQKHWFDFSLSTVQFSPNAKGKHLWNAFIMIYQQEWNAHLWVWICDPGIKILYSARYALMWFRALTFLQVYQEHSFYLLQTIWQWLCWQWRHPHTTGSGSYLCSNSQIMIKECLAVGHITQCSLLLFVFHSVFRMKIFLLKESVGRGHWGS